LILSLLLTPRPPISTLFPYTTLFRSRQSRHYPALHVTSSTGRIGGNLGAIYSCQPGTVCNSVHRDCKVVAPLHSPRGSGAHRRNAVAHGPSYCYRLS